MSGKGSLSMVLEEEIKKKFFFLNSVTDPRQSRKIYSTFIPTDAFIIFHSNLARLNEYVRMNTIKMFASP